MTYRTFIFGLLSPVLAAALGVAMYSTLTSASTDRDADFFFRLTMTAIAMAVPGLLTLFFAVRDRRRSPLAWPAKVGLTVAVLSLLLTAFPLKGLYDRTRQAARLSLSGIEAPEFDTTDINGRRYRLTDYDGKVILVNIWATWCPPCRREMPDLDRLYQERRDEGLMIFGISTEDLSTQRDFSQKLKVSYPLLTVEGEVPEIYSQTARYPANFLIDRKGKLQAAPSADQPFEALEAAVDKLLQASPATPAER